MTENMVKLCELLSENPEFQKEFTECTDHATFIQMAAEHGITLTEADFQAPKGFKELDLDELGAVAGGKACGCFVGGGGEASMRNQRVCACPVIGLGFFDTTCGSNGYDSLPYMNIRCGCDLGGGGGNLWCEGNGNF